MLDRSKQTAFRIAAIYFLASILWILFSGRLLELAVSDPALVTRLQRWKDLIFVAGTTLLLYLLQQRELAQLAQADRELRQNHDRTLTLLNTLPDHIIRLRLDGYVVDYRGASESDFQLRVDQIQNEMIKDVFPPPIGDTFLLTIETVLRTFKPSIFEFSPEEDGQRFEVRMVPSGEEEAIAIIRNITDIQRVGEILRRADHEKEVILDSLVEHVIYSNPELEILWANEAAVSSTPFLREELIGKKCYEIWAGRDTPCEDCPVEAAIRSGNMVERERATPDGRTWFIRGYPVCDEDENIIGGIEVTLETTEQKLAERALEESEIRYRSLFRGAKDAILLMLDGRVRECNPFAADMFGAARDEMLGWAVIDFSPAVQPDGSDSAVAAEEHLQAAIRGEPQFFYWKHQRKDGSLFDAEVSLSPIEIDKIVYVQAIVRDITERVKATMSLQQYADRLQLLRQVDQAILEAHSAEDVAAAAVRHLRRVGVCDRASITLIDEDKMETRVVAVDVEGETELSVGKAVRLQEPGSLEKIQQSGVQVFSDLTSIKEPNETVRQLLAEGIRSYSNIPLVAQGGLFGVLHLGSRDTGELSAENVEIAQEVANVLSVALHQASLNERVQQHAAILEERVEERTRELAEANNRLQELDRLKSEFVSNVSHELRTPITNIMLYLDLFNHPDRQGRQDEFLDILKDEARRLSRLIEDLLTLSRMEQSSQLIDKELHVLDAIIADVFKALQAQAKDKDIVLQHEMNQTIPAVEVNRDQIVQVLTNLVTNAIVYSGAGKTVQISSTLCRTEETRFVCLLIHNDGSHIDEEDLPHIFERFYRGQSGQLSGEAGTGLGLAISKEIIERHRGQIEVVSNPEDGTTFTIWLPIRTVERGQGG